MSLESNQRYIKPEGVLLQELDGEAVLLNLDNGQYYGLDAVGCRMYQLLLSSPSPAQVFEALLAEYEVSPQKLEQDLSNLLQRLLDNGLVQRA